MPVQYTLTCADANTWLDKLQWTGWGTPTAHATGELWQNDCEPSCARGQFVQYPASATATDMVNGHYTWLEVSAPQAPGGPYDYVIDSQGPR